jgi:predicted DNA binding CopG/RHH family protein
MSSRKAANGRKTIPQFHSVEEESAFWDSHSFLDFGNWEAVPYDEVCRDLASRNEPKLPVTFRLEKRLIRKLKEAARRHGIKYQVLAREILWRSLSRKQG